MTKIKELKKPVNKDLVLLLTQALESAKAGETIGVVLLAHMAGNGVQNLAAGDMELSEAILCFESFKFDQLMMAHQGRCE